MNKRYFNLREIIFVFTPTGLSSLRSHQPLTFRSQDRSKRKPIIYDILHFFLGQTPIIWWSSNFYELVHIQSLSHPSQRVLNGTVSLTFFISGFHNSILYCILFIYQKTNDIVVDKSWWPMKLACFVNKGLDSSHFFFLFCVFGRQLESRQFSLQVTILPTSVFQKKGKKKIFIYIYFTE